MGGRPSPPRCTRTTGGFSLASGLQPPVLLPSFLELRSSRDLLTARSVDTTLACLLSVSEKDIKGSLLLPKSSGEGTLALPFQELSPFAQDPG